MRKGHGSTKVPGVKLRPQAPKASGSKSNRSAPSWLNADDDGITEQVILDSSKRPFVGIVLCASCVPDKPIIFQQAVELGAQTSSSLTDIVTHLICIGPGSAKYSYCARHGVPIMHPSWIIEAHQNWLKGEAVDPQASMEAHRLPIFATASLSLTGIPDLDMRTQMQKLTKTNGGKFVKDIGPGSKVTHLVCGADRGEDVDTRGWSEKMRLVERFNATLQEKVHIVWEEWFWDCVTFRGQLDEAAYDVNRPRPKRKLRRDNTPLLQPISSLADAHTKNSATTPVESEKPDFGEEIVTGRKLPGSSTRVFEGLLKNRGFEVKSGKLVRSPSKAKAAESFPAKHLPQEPSDEPTKKSKVQGKSGTALSAFRRTKSFAPASFDLNGANIMSTSMASLQRTSSAREVPLLSSRPLVKPDAVVEQKAQTPGPKHVPSGEKHLFVGYKFVALGDAKSAHIDNEITLRGGMVVDDKYHADFILVRLTSGKRLRDEEPLESLRSRFRTECWLEQCIFEERMCEASEHVAFVPLDVDTPLPGAESLRVHISGYAAHSKTFSVRLLKTIGAPIAEQLTRKATHMLTCSSATAKYAKAQEWGVPCVGVEWLYDCIKFGKVQSADSYVLKTGDSLQESSSSGPITDITNEDFVQGASNSPSKQPSTELETTSKSKSFTDGMQLSWNPTGLLLNCVNEDTGLLGNLTPEMQSDTTLSRSTTEPLSVLIDLSCSPVAKASSSSRDVSNTASTDDDQTKIPSSNTPSPIKLPTTSSSFGSPTKQSTNALKSAITSLLGKRHLSEEQETDLNAGTRSGKRAKPLPRSKSKPTSSSKLRTMSSAEFPEKHATIIDYPLFAGGDGLQVPGIDQNTSADDSMRVTYEDPGQMDEKRRLMRLLTNGPDPDETPDNEGETKALPTKRGRNLVRRSTRS